jgi:hypothetical protein
MLTASPHIYIQCDVPEGMTLVEWRRAHPAPKRRRRLLPGFRSTRS